MGSYQGPWAYQDSPLEALCRSGPVWNHQEGRSEPPALGTAASQDITADWGTVNVTPALPTTQAGVLSPGKIRSPDVARVGEGKSRLSTWHCLGFHAKAE